MNNDNIIALEPGEFEMRQAFEEVTTKNVRTVIEYSKETRDLIRKLEEKVDLLERKYRNQVSTIDDQRKLISNLQVKLFSGGTA